MKRVYVSDGETKLGWFDEETREATPESEDHREPLSAAARDWVAPVPKTKKRNHPVSRLADAESSATTQPATKRPDRDLTLNAAGGHAQAKADQLLAEKGWWERAADKYLMRKTESEAWRRGALGERLVGKILKNLGSEWKVLHGIPAGPRGADIDHLLIGPMGVFTINTKNHTRTPVKVTSAAVYTGNNYRTNYLAKARKEASLAANKLGIGTFPIICIIPDTAGRFIEKSQPQDVLVIRSDELAAWLSTLLPKHSTVEVDRLFELARRSSTWET